MTEAQLRLDIRPPDKSADVREHPRVTGLRPVRTQSTPAPSILPSVTEVAHLLGCGRTLVYELISAGQLETVKLGRLRRVPADAIDSLVGRLRAASPRGLSE